MSEKGYYAIEEGKLVVKTQSGLLEPKAEDIPQAIRVVEELAQSEHSDYGQYLQEMDSLEFRQVKETSVMLGNQWMTKKALGHYFDCAAALPQHYAERALDWIEQLKTLKFERDAFKRLLILRSSFDSKPISFNELVQFLQQIPNSTVYSKRLKDQGWSGGSQPRKWNFFLEETVGNPWFTMLDLEKNTAITYKDPKIALSRTVSDIIGERTNKFVDISTIPYIEVKWLVQVFQDGLFRQLDKVYWTIPPAPLVVSTRRKQRSVSPRESPMSNPSPVQTPPPLRSPFVRRPLVEGSSKGAERLRGEAEREAEREAEELEVERRKAAELEVERRELEAEREVERWEQEEAERKREQEEDERKREQEEDERKREQEEKEKAEVVNECQPTDLTRSLVKKMEIWANNRNTKPEGQKLKGFEAFATAGEHPAGLESLKALDKHLIRSFYEKGNKLRNGVLLRVFNSESNPAAIAEILPRNEPRESLEIVTIQSDPNVKGAGTRLVKCIQKEFAHLPIITLAVLKSWNFWFKLGFKVLANDELNKYVTKPPKHKGYEGYVALGWGNGLEYQDNFPWTEVFTKLSAQKTQQGWKKQWATFEKLKFNWTEPVKFKTPKPFSAPAKKKTSLIVKGKRKGRGT